MGLFKDLFRHLQIFGEGGDGGAGAAPGGAPAEGQVAENTGANVPDAGEQQQTAESWADVKKRYEKEYGEDVSKAIKGRVKNLKAAEAKAARMEAILQKMGPYMYEDVMGEDGVLDLDALEREANGDDRLIEERASKRGMSPDTLRYVEGLEAEKAERDSYDNYMRLTAQAEKARELYPNLDLNVEMDNPEFARLIRNNVPVDTAYFVVHKDELTAAMMQTAAQKNAEAMSNSIQAGQNRPRENGLGRQAAANTQRMFDPRNMTREERKQLRYRVEVLGEKIPL
jgi:hypothetical protein